MTVAYRTTLTGACPRPEPLVQATRDLDRGRITPAQAEAAFEAGEAEVRRLETGLGLDAITGGYLRWSDLFRPFTELWHGASAGTLSRFFETNTFYRQPVLESVPTPGRGRLADWLPHGPGARAIVPGPYTFAALADVRYATTSVGGPVVDIAEALAAELLGLGAARPDHVQFLEPMLAVEPPGADLPALVQAYRRLTGAASGATTSVWTYFADAVPVLDVAAQLPVDVVGFDVFETDVPASARLGGKGLGVGCIDPTTTLAEEPASLAALVRDLERKLDPPVVWLGPSPPLDLLPFGAAATKLALLPRLREELRR